MTTDEYLEENPAYRAWWNMARAYQSVYNALDHFCEERGITGAQFGVLRCVADAGEDGLMLSDLSRRLMVSCGNITGVVDRLEHAGYLRRERSLADRRVILARLTPAGRTLFAEVWPEFQESLRRMLSGLSDDEQESLARNSRRLHVFLTEKWSPESPTAETTSGPDGEREG
jgi:DNA-binding MarR family transcriptional regulator